MFYLISSSNNLTFSGLYFLWTLLSLDFTFSGPTLNFLHHLSCLVLNQFLMICFRCALKTTEGLRAVWANGGTTRIFFPLDALVSFFATLVSCFAALVWFFAAVVSFFATLVRFFCYSGVSFLLLWCDFLLLWWVFFATLVSFFCCPGVSFLLPWCDVFAALVSFFAALVSHLKNTWVFAPFVRWTLVYVGPK